MDFLIFKSFTPEIFLSICVLLQLLLNSIIIVDINSKHPVLNKELLSQIFFILFCLIILYSNSKISCFFFNNIFINDENSRVLKIILTSIFFLITPIIVKNFNLQKLNFPEYFSIVFFSFLSLLLLINSSDMISVYILVEIQALSFYVLACFKRNSSYGTEASLKYFISGSFISGIFLLACSLLYGVLGTLNLEYILLLFSFPIENSNSLHLINISVILITSTFLFKLSAAPFHFWSPDVYEGSPLCSTIVFSILPKLILFNFLIKWLIILNNNFISIKLLLVISSILSIFFGAFLSIVQKRLKRFILFSSIAQTGFIVGGLSIINLNSLISVYFFILIYLFTSLLIWFNITLLYSYQSKSINFYNNDKTSLFLSNLIHFSKFNKLIFFSFILIFFSLAGIPPLSGFLSKLFILLELIENDLFIIALILILISSISVFYYLRILKIMGFESNKSIKKINFCNVVYLESNDLFIIISLLLYLLLYFFYYPSNLILIIQYIIFSSIYF